MQLSRAKRDEIVCKFEFCIIQSIAFSSVASSFFFTKINMIKYERGNVFNCSLLRTSEQLVY